MTGMSTATDAPWPTGATEVSDWADVGKPDEFGSFDGPIWTIPEVVQDHRDGTPARVFVSGTQLRDGTVEERCIRLEGVAWEDMLTSSVARKISTSLAEAADDLARLGSGGNQSCLADVLRIVRPAITLRWRAEPFGKSGVLSPT